MQSTPYIRSFARALNAKNKSLIIVERIYGSKSAFQPLFPRASLASRFHSIKSAECSAERTCARSASSSASAPTKGKEQKWNQKRIMRKKIPDERPGILESFRPARAFLDKRAHTRARPSMCSSILMQSRAHHRFDKCL